MQVLLLSLCHVICENVSEGIPKFYPKIVHDYPTPGINKILRGNIYLVRPKWSVI